MRKGISLLSTLVVVMILCVGTSSFTGEQMKPLVKIKSHATASYQSGYNPSLIKNAYGINTITGQGAGKTIAIVDAYGSPTIQNDFIKFNQQFNLPGKTLTDANNYLKVAYPQGTKVLKDGGWALETAMDVEWAHALAPQARILLVVAKSSSLNDLLAAVDYASQYSDKYGRVNVVSMSWGAAEFSSEINYENHFTNAGITYIASSGDNGAGVLWPSVSPNVLSVGGTTLKLDPSSGKRLDETGWSGSGGGISKYLHSKDYQVPFNTINNDVYREVPDVSFDADPATGVAVYSSTSYSNTSGWFVVGGTSFGAPAWASFTALGSQTGKINSILYASAGTNLYSKNYQDVYAGSNGTYSARTGYDLVTGLGSPKQDALVNYLK